MNKMGKVLILMAALILLFSGVIYAQSYTIASIDEIESFKDPASTTWNESSIDGSLILSWDAGNTGISGGFCDATVYTPFPDGGKYEVSLISVLFSDDDTIKGVWEVKKNDNTVIITLGKATGLASPIGGVITITIDGFVITIRISFKIAGLLAPEEIEGKILVDGVPLDGANAIIRGGGVVIDNIPTDPNGQYLFLIDPDDVKRIVIVFKNFDSEIVVSGYAFVGGQPLAGATVTVRNKEGVLDTIVTDADGYYESASIIGATGAGKNVIRTIIQM